MTIQKNPASDLKFLINRFRETSVSRSKETAFSNWSIALNAEKNTVFEKLIALQKLVLTVESLILHDAELLVKDRYLSCIGPIQQSLLPAQLQQTSDTFTRGVFADSGGPMMALDFCIERLSKTKPETQITKQELDKLRIEGQDLKAAVLNSVEDVNLRIYLAELLQCFNYGLDSYAINGVSSIEDSLDLVLGKITRQKDKLKSASPKDQSIFKTVTDYFHKGGQIADDAKKIAGMGQLGYEAFKLISN